VASEPMNADGGFSEWLTSTNQLPSATQSNTGRPNREQSYFAAMVASTRSLASRFVRRQPGRSLECSTSRAASRLSSSRSYRLPLVMLLFHCLTQGANAQTVAEVRLGGLFQRTPEQLGRFAAFVMAVKEINDTPGLLQKPNSPNPLPHATLR
jgi:hypothetical protein